MCPFKRNKGVVLYSLQNNFVSLFNEMSSADRLDVLRERNKALLVQLTRQRNKLEAVSGGLQSRKRDREDGSDEGSESEEVLTRTDGDRGPARAALAKPTVTFSDTSGHPTEHRGYNVKHTASSGRFKKDRHHPVSETKSSNTQSCLKGQHTLQSVECGDTHPPHRHHLQPLLGYDWIAGVLDAEDSLVERSDEFFNDLCTFRSINKDQCVHSLETGFSEETNSALPLASEKDRPDCNKDTHQCTFSYRINSRLFPVPLNSQECCPVCKKHKSTHPHTAAEPALIRVSIPRSTLLPPYKYKAHRRCSFDPSDSLGLPSHCLSGWSNTGQSALTPQSSLDLRSCLETKGTENKELEGLSAFKVSSSQKPGQVPHVSLLARHNFHHFSPRKKK